MRKIIAGVLKEFWLLKRDIHALLVLFVMPAFFILLMSLAMRDAFSEHSGIRVAAMIIDEDKTPTSEQLLSHLKQTKGFKWTVISNKTSSEMIQVIKEKKILVSVVIKKGFEQTLQSNGEVAKTVNLLIDPESTPVIKLLFESAVTGNVAKISMVNHLSALNPWMTSEEKESALADRKWYEVRFLQGENSSSAHPTSVQQSVPAWLIFSMFFIIIPISHTFVTERRLGTLSRLAVMNVSVSGLLISKFIPYFLINQLQFVLMLAVGVWAVPLFGGDSLVITHNYGSLAIVSAVLSFATIAYALSIASLVRTTDQAVTIGGLLNIIFAAIGGVMIPLFVMPDFMQNLAVVSPMFWALDSFLKLFLHRSPLVEIAPALGGLIAFGIICLSIAIYRLRKELKEAQ